MSHTNPSARRTWPWVVLVVVVVAAIIVGISLISNALGAKPATVAATPPPAVQPTTTPSVTPVVTATAKPHTGLTAKQIAQIEGAIEDGDAAELYNRLAEPVHVQFAASDFDSNRSPANAVTDLSYVNGLTDWNWDLDPATLASYRAGAYGDSFPVGAIVGQSEEGYVISFTITKTKVSAIFVSKSVALVTAPKS